MQLSKSTAATRRGVFGKSTMLLSVAALFIATLTLGSQEVLANQDIMPINLNKYFNQLHKSAAE